MTEEEKKGFEYYIRGKKLFDEGERKLGQARKLRMAADMLLDDIEKINEKIQRQKEEAGELFVAGHDLIEEAQRLWKEREEILSSELRTDDV